MSERLLSPAERSAKETAIREQGKANAAQAGQLQSEVADLIRQQEAVPMTGRIQTGYEQVRGGYAGFVTGHRPVYTLNYEPRYEPYYSEAEQAQISSIYSQIQQKNSAIAALGGIPASVAEPAFREPDTKSGLPGTSIDYAGTLAARQAGFDVGSGIAIGLAPTFEREQDKRLAALNPNYVGPSATRFDPFKPVESGGLFDVKTKAPKVAGFNPATQKGYNPITGTVTPQNPRKKVTSQQSVISSAPISYDEIDVGLAPETKPFGASIKSVVSPIAFTPLKGSAVTARTYQSVKNQPATTENLLGVVGKPVTKTFTTPIGGNATKAIQAQLKYSASIQNRPAEIGGFNLLPSAFAETPQPTLQTPIVGGVDYTKTLQTLAEIRQKGGRQITITTPGGKKTTVPIDQAIGVISGNPEAGNYGFEFIGAPTAAQRATKIQALKENQKSILGVIEKARKTGANEITIIEESGKKTTVPLSRAFYDITKSFQTNKNLNFEYGGISAQEKNASISSVQKNAVSQISDFTKQAKADYADTITIKSEDGKVQTVPLSQAQLEIRRATAGGKKVELSYIPLPKPITLTDAAKEVERMTGLGGITSPGLAYLDRELQLNLPYEQRSKQTRQIGGIPKNIISGISNYEIGRDFAPIANILAESYDFTKAVGKQIKTQYPFVEPPNKGSIFPRLKTTLGIKGETPFVPHEILGLPVARKQTPQQATAIGDIFAGKPVDITSNEFQGSLAGEAALQTGLYFLFRGAGTTGESVFGKAGKVKDTNVKLKVIESYEIPDVMRKPPGEGMRPLNRLYTEPLRLETPEQLTVKQMREANIATNIMKARTEELIGKGASEIAMKYNPVTEKIQSEIIRINLGKGRGFVPGEGGGGIGGGPGDLGGLPPGGGTGKTVKIGKIEDVVKIAPATPDVFTLEPYADLTKAQPETAQAASRSGVDIRFPSSTVEDTAARGFNILKAIARKTEPVSLGRGLGKKLPPKPVSDNRVIDTIARSIKVTESTGVSIGRGTWKKNPMEDYFQFIYSMKMGRGEGFVYRPDILKVTKENMGRPPIRFAGGKLRIRFPETTVEDTAARIGKKGRISLGSGSTFITDISGKAIATDIRFGKANKNFEMFTKPNEPENIYVNKNLNDKRFLENPDVVAELISHETIHPTLEKLVGKKTSSSFDNLFKEQINEKLQKKLVPEAFKESDAIVEINKALDIKNIFPFKEPKTIQEKPKPLTLNIRPFTEPKPTKREGRQPKLGLLEKSMIDKQVEKILKLDINAGRLEKTGGIKTVKLSIPKPAKAKTRFTNIYKSFPEGFPPLYEPQNARLIRVPGIGKAILEGKPVNINPRALPPTALRNRGRMRQPLITIPRTDIGTVTKVLRLPRPKTGTKTDTGLAILTIPKTGYPPITETLTVPALDIPQKRKTKTSLLNIPDQPQELITELRFPGEPPPQRSRGAFFLPPGGRGGGGYGRGRRTRKTFYTNPSDPLRAGVILTQGVPELVSRSPKIFKQVDVLLAKSRKRNKYAGLDQPPVGVNIKFNFGKNLNIKI